MKLYKRDFTKLTDKELISWQQIKGEESVQGNEGLTLRKNLFNAYPKAVRHFISLFPNQYLDIMELKEEDRLLSQLSKFKKLLDMKGVNERQILNFIRCEEAYFLVVSILKMYFNFGHHDAFLFPEFPLGTSFRVDYLLIGKSSDGWSFVFIELEAPSENTTLSGGHLGSSFRKGLSQIEDWDTWLDSHFSHLQETFRKYQNQTVSLPHEFINLDKSRIYYVVISGRREDFSEMTYRIRRKKMRESTQLLLHYDNIIDSAKNVIGGHTY